VLLRQPLEELACSETQVNPLLQFLTMGRRASETAREWFAQNRYHYLYLHGLSVEMAEAFAENLHKRIHGELGFAAHEARDP
jgi:5-methyltetrahydrofolate--homocysteine methyltransferase